MTEENRTHEQGLPAQHSQEHAVPAEQPQEAQPQDAQRSLPEVAQAILAMADDAKAIGIPTAVGLGVVALKGGGNRPPPPPTDASPPE